MLLPEMYVNISWVFLLSCPVYNIHHELQMMHPCSFKSFNNPPPVVKYGHENAIQIRKPSIVDRQSPIVCLYILLYCIEQ